jgi:hypothetical protein
MLYSKKELAQKSSADVRRDGTLVELFKQFITEDWGAIPSGCFGCDFKRHFDKWADPYRKGIGNNTLKVKNTMENKKYVLKDENFKTFFKGEVLSKNSTSEEWANFINENPEQVEKRKNYFKVLPESMLSEKEKVEAKELISEEEAEKKPESVAPAVAEKEQTEDDLLGPAPTKSKNPKNK